MEENKDQTPSNESVGTWNTKNDNLFASFEEKCWRKTNEKYESTTLYLSPLSTYQIDVSWIGKGSVNGLRACDTNLSVLHVEIEGLFWTSSCMKHMNIILIRFETDYSGLVDMTINPMD